MNDYIKAITYLRPGAQFVLSGDDLDNIIWHEVDGEPPSADEILAAIEPALEAESARKADEAARKAALLDRLGITEDEARLLLS